MKTKSMLVALMLLMTSSDVFAKASFIDAIMYTKWANFAGSHNRCPRFQIIEEAISAELAEAGVTSRDLDYYGGDGNFPNQYNADPSAFCKRVWDLLGPNGTYKRQMLEAK
jgi:hypothetical protein